MATTDPEVSQGAARRSGTAENEERRTAQGRGELARREDVWPAFLGLGPFGLMRHLIEDMFGDVDRGRPLGPRDAGQWEGGLLWSPRIDMAEKNGRLEIRADLPGMTKSDVRIETRDDVIILEGERRSEQEESKGGVYRTERTYGKFRRVIPLPEGTNTDQATATFRNGVLEITMKAPDRNASRGKRLEIQEGTAGAAEPQTRH